MLPGWYFTAYKHSNYTILEAKKSLLISGDYEYAAVCIPTHRLNNPGVNGCIMYVQSGQEPTSVTIATYTDTQEVQLEPGEVRTISFGEDMFPIDGAESKAIRLTSSEEIQVLVYKDSDDGSVEYNGVYQVPNGRANGTFFLTAASNKREGCSTSNSVNQFYLVSTFYDNTTIKVTPRSDEPFEVFLPSFGTFTHVTFNWLDLIADGTQISSNVPINVVSGNLCDAYQLTSSGSLVSSIPPVINLTNDYLVPHLISQNTSSPGFYLIVVAVENDTLVEFDGEQTVLSTVGSSATFDHDNTREWMCLNCSKNCLAVQFSLTVRDVFGRFMMSLLPTENFNTWAFFTTLDIHATSYTSLVVEGEDPGSDIFLNGISLGDLDWRTLQGYATAETAISQGTYILESINNRPFGAYVYCHSEHYTGAAGYALLPLSTDIIPTTFPTTTTPPAMDNLPQISVRLNGTVYTEDGQDMTSLCTQVK